MVSLRARFPNWTLVSKESESTFGGSCKIWNLPWTFRVLVRHILYPPPTNGKKIYFQNIVCDEGIYFLYTSVIDTKPKLFLLITENILEKYSSQSLCCWCIWEQSAFLSFSTCRKESIMSDLYWNAVNDILKADDTPEVPNTYVNVSLALRH